MFEETLLLYPILFLSLLVVIFLIKANNIIDVILLNSAFSLFTVVMYLILDAPDVAMTEAAVSVLASVFAVLAVKSIYNNNYQFEEKFNPTLFLLMMISAGIFIYACMDMPEFGKPVINNVYFKNNKEDVGISSLVTAILAGYRGYDTLLETIVILLGGVSVLLVSEQNKLPDPQEKDHLVLTMSRLIIPVIVLFALYLQFHGEISPGGGFQAGAVCGAAFIIYAISNSILLNSNFLNKLKNIAVLGAGIYLVIGVISLVGNLEFLNYNVFSSNKLFAQKLGFILVEIGVGITVSAVMLLIYSCLALEDYVSNKYKL